MEIPAPLRKPRGEAILPMINVVFLLLVFFLMSAQLAPPEPVEIAPPRAASDTPAEARLAAWLDATGTLYYQDTQGAAAEAALATALAIRDDKRIALNADAQAPGAALTSAMARLAAAGASRVDLAVARP